jgi:nickel-dependent lactate racemase
MPAYRIPYGRGEVVCRLPDDRRAVLIAPADVPVASDPARRAAQALDEEVGGVRLSDFGAARSVAIAINDKTRPVPLGLLLPPLLERLHRAGVGREAVTFIIAAGSHPPMAREEFGEVVPADVLARYGVICHDAEDRASLVNLGTTRRGTPVWVNRAFAEADLRLVVGNIEPHQFMGFSGGVKTAAIGLAAKETINHNHSMMSDPRSALGRFDDNPARQDVEEIGRMLGVQFAVNAILNENKQVVEILAGEPAAVMRAGIPLALRLYESRVPALFDLMIVSPGGHPKDINLYQAQKALAHASRVTRDGGTVALVAACPEGTGSASYEKWVRGMASHAAVIERFRGEGFRIGPHKAFQIARDAARVRVLLVSQMPPDLVRELLLTPCGSVEEAVATALAGLAAGARIGVMPFGNGTIPVLIRPRANR